MFKRILYEQWTAIVPIVAFCLTFGVFVAMTIRAWLMKQPEVEHMANMPLEGEQPLTPCADHE